MAFVSSHSSLPYDPPGSFHIVHSNAFQNSVRQCSEEVVSQFGAAHRASRRHTSASTLGCMQQFIGAQYPAQRPSTKAPRSMNRLYTDRDRGEQRRETCILGAPSSNQTGGNGPTPCAEDASKNARYFSKARPRVSFTTSNSLAYNPALPATASGCRMPQLQPSRSEPLSDDQQGSLNALSTSTPQPWRWRCSTCCRHCC